MFILSYQAESQVVRGFIDLRNLPDDFESEVLDGEWEFYWKKLLSAGEKIEDDSAIYHQVPLMWNGQVLTDGTELEGMAYASYRLTVLLDKEQDLAIFIPAVYNSYSFQINGHLIAKNGVVGTNKENSVPFWSQIVAPIEHAYLKDTNEFLLQVSNFRHDNGGPVDNIIIGERDYLINKIEKIRITDAMVSGSLLMAGFFFLGLFFYGRNQRVILYFALYCFVFSYYNFASGSYLLQHLFPNLSWEFTVRIEYGTLYVSALLFSIFTESIYPKDTPRKLLRVIYLAIILQLIFLIVTPVWFFTMLHKYWMMLVLMIIILGIFIYLKAAHRKRVGSTYSLIGAIFIMFVLTWRILDVLGVVQMPFYLMPVGIIVFFFLHSLTLSQQFADKWRRAKDSAEQALKIKSEFLSAMSHEIRTPMNAVIGLTNYLLEDAPKKNQIKNLNTLKFSAENLLVIINDILDFSKLEANKVDLDYQWVQIRTLGEQLMNSATPLVGDKPVELSLTINEDVPISIWCDITRTSQVLTNLINNAIKFTSKGFVRLKISVISKNANTVRLLFNVMDSGIGIPENKLSEIFESFTQVSSSTTREYGGTGLGLAISSKLLQLQNSELKVQSEEGVGSVFYFEQEFSYKESKESKVVKTETNIDVSLEGRRILLVEDNQVNVMVAKRFLTKWGIDLEYAENGEEAIIKVSENEFDLILMDLQMPVMDGYEATKAIRIMGINTPIVALTASALLDKNDKLVASGFTDSVTKPFQPDTLFAKISMYVK